LRSKPPQLKMNKITRVKICCIGSIEEALLAVDYGASALGLVSDMPSGPGVIEEELIGEIVSIIPPGVASFLLTCRQNANDIIAQQKKTGANVIQLCDRLSTRNYRLLKNSLKGISIVQVVHVNDEDSIEEAVEASKYVDAILLDSGNQNLSVKELGGTGRIHDWDISAVIKKEINIPLFLAGGLNPENVKEAINKVDPFAVDVCSGVRTNGSLDKIKLARFFDQINSI
jgi:phosphoribosylanthranilate isomerase